MALPKLAAAALAAPVGLGKLGLSTAAGVIKGAIRPYTPRGIISGIKGNLGMDVTGASVGAEAIKDAYARLSGSESKKDKKEKAEKQDKELRERARKTEEQAVKNIGFKGKDNDREWRDGVIKRLDTINKTLEKIQKKLSPGKGSEKAGLLGAGAGIGGMLGNLFDGIKGLFSKEGLLGALAGMLGLRAGGKLIGGAVRAGGRLIGGAARAGGSLIGKGLGAVGRVVSKPLAAGIGAIAAAGPVKSLIEKFSGSAAKTAGTEVAEGAAKKVAVEGGEKVAESAAKKVGVEGAEKVAETATKKVAKEVGTEAAEKGVKSGIRSKIAGAIAKRLPKALGGAAVKQIPLLGLAISAGFAISKLMEGDTTGAALAAAEGLPVAGIPAAIAGVTRDVYNDVYGTPDNKYPFDSDLKDNPTLFKQRQGDIYTQVKEAADDFLGTGAKKPPANEGQQAVPPVSPNAAAGAPGSTEALKPSVAQGAAGSSSGGQLLQESPNAGGVLPQTRNVDQLSAGSSGGSAPVVVNNFNQTTTNSGQGGRSGPDLSIAAPASGYRTPADIGSYSREGFNTI